MINKRKLQSCMKIYGDTVESLAEYLEYAVSTVSCKMNGKIKVTLEDAGKIAVRYNLTHEEFFDIFYQSFQRNVKLINHLSKGAKQ